VKRKWIFAVVFAGIVGVLVWANLRQVGGNPVTASGANGPKGAPLVKVTKVAPQNLTQKVLAPGTLEASGSREIRAPFSTLSVKLLVGAGDTVAEGQVIAELESTDLRLQVASQEAMVARAEATVAQYRQQQQSAPTQLAMKLESARAQLSAAEAGLQSALKQADSARQRLEQAQAPLLTARTRASTGNAEVTAARQKLQEADTAYRATPLSAAARGAFDAAQIAYEDALRHSTDAARQAASDLDQANLAVGQAERDVAEAGEDSPAVQQARASLASARLALEAARTDVAAGGVSAEQIRSAEADLAAQRASLQNLQEKLSQASIKAPAAGTVLGVSVKSGQSAQQGQAICELGGLGLLTLKARVDETEVVRVKVGQPLSVKNNAFPNERFDGTVTRVAAQAGAAAGSGTAVAAGASFYEVQGEVTNHDGKLKAGMSAEARVITETRTGVMVVGLESVRENGDKAEVLVVIDHKITVRPVKLGVRTQTQVEISDGLAAGEQVVVGPFTLIKGLTDGEAVRVEEVPAQERGDEE
jgi:HlyD family secretion protein